MMLRFLLLAAVFAAAASAAPKDDILAADRAFSAMSADHGRHAAFLAFMTDDARLYQGPARPIQGKAAATAYFAEEAKSDPDYAKEKLVWTPLEAEASQDGSLGWTRGRYDYSGPAKDGRIVTSTGYYVTEWRRQADGRYKFCLDIGGSDQH